MTTERTEIAPVEWKQDRTALVKQLSEAASTTVFEELKFALGRGVMNLMKLTNIIDDAKTSPRDVISAITKFEELKSALLDRFGTDDPVKQALVAAIREAISNHLDIESWQAWDDADRPGWTTKTAKRLREVGQGTLADMLEAIDVDVVTKSATRLTNGPSTTP